MEKKTSRRAHNCPQCGRAMRRMDTGERIPAFTCLPCRSLWLPIDEKVAWARDGHLDEKEANVHCLVCLSALRGLHLREDDPEVIAQRCPKGCGVWVGQAEWPRLLSMRAPAGPPPETPEERQARREAAVVAHTHRARYDILALVLIVMAGVGALLASRARLLEPAANPPERVARVNPPGSDAAEVVAPAATPVSEQEVAEEPPPADERFEYEWEREAADAGESFEDEPEPTEPPADVEQSIEGEISVYNASGRSGYYYLPQGYNDRDLPLLVALHGSGGSGRDMVALFRDLAEEYDFAIAAPDSLDARGWLVGDAENLFTADLEHILECVDEVRDLPGIYVEDSRVLVAGYSAGGSSAPYVASHSSFFTHFAVLHGGSDAFGGFGRNRVPGWYSTGASDSLRPPRRVREKMNRLSDEAGFWDVEYHEYPGGHGLSAQELRDMVEWWLS